MTLGAQDEHEVSPPPGYVAPPVVHVQPDGNGTPVIDEGPQEHLSLSARAEQDTLPDIHDVSVGAVIPGENLEDVGNSVPDENEEIDGNSVARILHVDHSSRAEKRGIGGVGIYRRLVGEE
ncbi:hypothetical protein V6N11_066780 [Hibiscus sabdariffa]|uniref:Uncharacterized protein n=1 Tax=Hibiscus sabdariffa TaxID=183260 RepID=A0ABR2SNU1_9ROSI